MLTFLTGSLEQFLDRYFESDEIKRLILANNLYGKHGGPRDPGSAMGLLFHLLSGGDDEKQGFSGHVIGGMGAITQAMAAACREAGVEIRTGAEVERIESANGRVTGVRLSGGEMLEAAYRRIQRRSETDLPQAGRPGSNWMRISGGRSSPSAMDGPAAKVNLVLNEEPRVNGMPADAPAAAKNAVHAGADFRAGAALL